MTGPPAGAVCGGGRAGVDGAVVHQRGGREYPGAAGVLASVHSRWATPEGARGDPALVQASWRALREPSRNQGESGRVLGTRTRPRSKECSDERARGLAGRGDVGTVEGSGSRR